MSVQYQAVNWNRQKRLYDLVVGIAAPGLVVLFAGATLLRHPHATLETALIRGLAVSAVVLLHVTISIGPLTRLVPALRPLLYNRRHLGVTTCLLALGHGGFALIQYHGSGDVNPLVSVLSANRALGSIASFPFELLGIAALLVLIVMAATSHDFWLATLTPPVWKRLHMLVYPAFALVVAHVALGALQNEGGLLVAAALAVGAGLVVGLHLAAGLRERPLDRERLAREGWVEVCGVDEIPEKRARIATISGERVAVFRYDGKVSAVSNVCKHQNGPLGEGRIIDGCITCPWHGYQYRPESGASPPPYTDTIPTFRTQIADGRVLIHPHPLPPGTAVEPSVVDRPLSAEERDAEFYVGYFPSSPPGIARRTRRAVVTLGLLVSGSVVGLALAQPPFAAATFEYGRPREVAGRLRALPYPVLVVETREGDLPVTSRHWLLAAPGKHGADAQVAAYDGRTVRIRGQLLHRGDAAMLEILAIDGTSTGPEPVATTHVELGTLTLTGEIVDSKCWMGAMNPGEGKTHLACAVRCVSGGLPPLLALRDGAGGERHLLLVNPDGGPVDRGALQGVGRPVSITGRVTREGELLFLHADPATYRILH